MSHPTNETKQFYRIKAALQELFGVIDEELLSDKELNDLLNVTANVALLYRTLGSKKAQELRRKQQKLRLVTRPTLRVVDPGSAGDEPDPA